MLVQTTTGPTTEEQGCKRHFIGAGRTGGVEVVVALLTEVLALHMRLPIIEVRERGFQRTLTRGIV